MLDALSPAANSFTEAVANGSSFLDSLKQGVDAAELGMKNTIPMLAKKGRASYLGDRSVGHQDPGATSIYLTLKTLLDIVEKNGVA